MHLSGTMGQCHIYLISPIAGIYKFWLKFCECILVVVYYTEISQSLSKLMSLKIFCVCGSASLLYIR